MRQQIQFYVVAMLVGAAILLAYAGVRQLLPISTADLYYATGSPVATMTPAPTIASSAAPSTFPAASAAAQHDGCPTSAPAAMAAGTTRNVTIETAKGDFVIKISADLSPIAAANFVALASCGYYDGVVFHRVVPSFVIQGGDPTGTGTGGPGYTIPDEPVTTPYHRATVAMARTSEPNSVGSQFFVVLDDSAAAALSSANTYQIIGEVTSGMESVDAIAAAADQELPTNPVVMDKVTVAP